MPWCTCDGEYEQITSKGWVRCRRCNGSRWRRIWNKIRRR